MSLVVTSQQPPLLEADFDNGSDGFSYVDDAFRGTNQPGYASGVRVSSGGYRGGALRVSLGGRDNNVIRGMSGGWSRTFTVPDLGSKEVILELRFQIVQTAEYESDEFSQALARVDGVLFGQRPFDYCGLIIGNGNGGNTRTSYWKLIGLRLGKLAKGTCRLTLGGCNNKKSLSNESTEVLIDEVRVRVEDPLDRLSGPRAVVALTSRSVASTMSLALARVVSRSIAASPSRIPRVKARPALVVASASKPRFFRIFADPVSQGLGTTKMPLVCRSAKRWPFCWVVVDMGGRTPGGSGLDEVLGEKRPVLGEP